MTVSRCCYGKTQMKIGLQRVTAAPLLLLVILSSCTFASRSNSRLISIRDLGMERSMWGGTYIAPLEQGGKEFCGALSLNVAVLSSVIAGGLSLRGGNGEFGEEGDTMDVDFKEGRGDAAARESIIGQADFINVTVRWKGRSLPLCMDLNQPVKALKERIWGVTDVVPDHQFLVGIYKQRQQDINLASLDIKSGQSLVLLGEPTRNSFARHCGTYVEDVQEETQEVVPDKDKRGFFSMAHLSQKELALLDKSKMRARLRQRFAADHGHEEGSMMTDDMETVDKARDAESEDEMKPRIQSIEEILEVEKHTRPTHFGQPPTTIPREFWGKQLGNLTVDEGSRLRAWMNKTREWKMQTKIDRELEWTLNETLAEKEQLRQDNRDINTYVDREEAELNTWGLSRVKSQMIVASGPELVSQVDFFWNQTVYDIFKYRFIGGMNWDDSARFIEYIDQIDSYLANRERQQTRDAVAQWRYARIMEPEWHRKAIEDSEEPSTPDEITKEDWGAWVKFLKEDKKYPEYLKQLKESAKEGDELPPRHMLWEDMQGPRINVVESVERHLQKGELRDWVNAGWSDFEMLPNGLLNIGNTCYMASAMQLLRAVPELMSYLKDWKRGKQSLDPTDNLVEAAQLTIKDLAEKYEPCAPHSFIYHLRQIFPQFAQMGPMGPQQQDAEECLSGILQAFSQKMRSPSGSNLIRDLFEIELETQTWCAENDQEESTLDIQKMLRIPLPIDKSCNTMHDCLHHAFNGQLEKHSPTLNRTAWYNTSIEISHLPPYIMMQYMRFYWRTDTNKKAKVCRNVFFPLVIDLMEYLSEDLKAPIQLNLAKRKAKFFKKKQMWSTMDVDEMPRKFAEWDRKQAEKVLMQQMGFLNISNADVEEDEEAMNRTNTEFEEARLKWLTHIGVEDEPEDANDVDEEEDLAKKDAENALKGGSSVMNSAMYQLKAIITHQSRFAEAGHYITYVRSSLRKSWGAKKAPEPVWIKFDDEKVTMVREDEVRNTAGGADNPIAYVCLYAKSDAVAEGLSTTQY